CPPVRPPARLVAGTGAGQPALVPTSVTAFGDRPPGGALHADDIVIAAMGGPMCLCGDEDRPPLRLPLWQAFCHAGAEAAVGTLLAHLARGRSGRGQRVVVNAQAAMVWTLMNAQAFPVLHGDSLRRGGPFVGSRGVRRRMVFPCAGGRRPGSTTPTSGASCAATTWTRSGARASSDPWRSRPTRRSRSRT